MRVPETVFIFYSEFQDKIPERLKYHLCHTNSPKLTDVVVWTLKTSQNFQHCYGIILVIQLTNIIVLIYNYIYVGIT